MVELAQQMDAINTAVDDIAVKPHVEQLEDSVDLEVSDKLGIPTYRAHPQLFAPSIAIFVLYSLGLIALVWNDMSSGSLFRLCAIVLGIGVPLLGVQAFLRHQTVRLQFFADNLRYHPGWPEDSPAEIPYALIENLKVKRGLSGRVFGGGTIVIKLTTGSKIAVADLERPLEAVAEFNRLAGTSG